MGPPKGFSYRAVLLSRLIMGGNKFSFFSLWAAFLLLFYPLPRRKTRIWPPINLWATSRDKYGAVFFSLFVSLFAPFLSLSAWRLMDRRLHVAPYKYTLTAPI